MSDFFLFLFFSFLLYAFVLVSYFLTFLFSLIPSFILSAEASRRRRREAWRWSVHNNRHKRTPFRRVNGTSLQGPSPPQFSPSLVLLQEAQMGATPGAQTSNDESWGLLRLGPSVHAVPRCLLASGPLNLIRATEQVSLLFFGPASAADCPCLGVILRTKIRYLWGVLREGGQVSAKDWTYCAARACVHVRAKDFFFSDLCKRMFGIKNAFWWRMFSNQEVKSTVGCVCQESCHHLMS